MRTNRLSFLAFLMQLFVLSSAKFQPNFLLIVTDDQDVELHGMHPMAQTRQLVADAGVSFTNAYTSSPLCCPSRASILSGLYAHNHHTTNNSESGGCNGRYWRENVEKHAIHLLLRAEAGYETFFAGKYLNQYRGAYVPPGWNEFYGLHGNSRYYNYTLRENEHNVSYTDTYLTDLLRDKAVDFLERQYQSQSTKPFFAMIAPPAPHAPFTPAERHRGAFAGLRALRTPNFNKLSNELDKHWLISDARIIPEDTLKTMDEYFQQRWETLLAVDELVAALVQRLEQQHRLNETYVIFTSDNGYHVGQFAQPFDKRQPYETDIRVPLYVSGPGIPASSTSNAPVLLIDLFPTILEWAQLLVPVNIDGQSLNSNIMNVHNVQHHRSLLIQHWGEGTLDTYNPECPYPARDRLTQCTKVADCHCQDAWNNTYACVRHFRGELNRLYCEFKDRENFVEAYDLTDDPYQLTNVGYELLPIERAFYSLALANLTHCAGDSCRTVNI